LVKGQKFSMQAGKEHLASGLIEISAVNRLAGCKPLTDQDQAGFGRF
jgi:hypothetical protein